MKHLIVAEDDKNIRLDIYESLSSSGYDVFPAQNGQIAWNHMQMSKIDLLITDIKMPRMNGYALINKMKDAGHKTPILVESSEFTPSATEGYIGRIEHLQKPFEPEELLQKVKEILGE